MADDDHRPFDLLIFDWDGTLMDSVGTIVECTRATLAELEIPEPEEATLRGVIGLSLAETVERLAGGHLDEELTRRIPEVYRRHWHGSFHDRSYLFAGVADMLSGFAAAEYLLAVATGKGRRGLNRDLTTTGIAEHFHATRTPDEARSKPHPQMVLDLLDELGVHPERALVVGDSIWDLQMAAAAGVPSVAVETGAHPRDRLLEHAPRACLPAVGELPGWLGDPTEDL